jgi:putative oxidoreductase
MEDNMVSPQFKSGLGLLVLRLGAAGIFMSYGAVKILSFGAAGWANPNLGLPGWLQAVVAWTELGGGALLLLGLLTRLAALALAIVQVGAIYLVTWRKELIDLSTTPANGPVNTLHAQPGWDFNLALITITLALVILGGGMIAIDHFLFGRRQAATTRTPEPAPAPTAAIT